MSATDKKQGINDYWREFGYDSDYESSLDKNKDNNSEEEQEEEENQYEEMENNGEEEMENNQYEEEYEEMVEQNNIPKLEHSFNAESKNRLQLPSQVDESELNPFNMSICAPNGYKAINIDWDKEEYVYGIGLGEPCDKYDRTVEVMKRKPSENKELNKEKENNIFNEKNNSLYRYVKRNKDGFVVDSIDDFAIGSDKRKTEGYTVAHQNSFKISNIKHGWQYFNTYGKFDYRTRQKLENEIIKYWEKIPEHLHQNAWNAIVNNDVAEMNNIMNKTFAQVTTIK